MNESLDGWRDEINGVCDTIKDQCKDVMLTSSIIRRQIKSMKNIGITIPEDEIPVDALFSYLVDVIWWLSYTRCSILAEQHTEYTVQDFEKWKEKLDTVCKKLKYFENSLWNEEPINREKRKLFHEALEELKNLTNIYF